MPFPRTALGKPALLAFALVAILGAPQAEAAKKKRVSVGELLRVAIEALPAKGAAKKGKK